MSDYVLVLVSAALVNHLILQRSPLSRPQLHVVGACSALAVMLGLILLQDLIFILQWQDLQLFLLLPLLALQALGLPKLFGQLRPAWRVDNLPSLLLGNTLVLGLLLQLGTLGQWLPSLGWGLAGGLGFWLALALFDDLRQRTDNDDMPIALRGLPIELIGAGVMVMAFSGFNGLFTQ
ncbi:Rnf-Nqr domain containing protein [Pseudomonas putida]|uniref:Electron transporter RnfA n=1 Tax=Pseudomonas putida TaxID=303 RepID=A0A1X0ZYM6_PSEPU|nr:Rnf-Nqr domain containing protein [Pseudomonas putida]ORL64808.1 electron transporter RnfA [Pseudomonas putida]